MKRELQKIAFSIFKQCLSFNIFVDVAWVPRLLNTEADFYSKIFDYDDWEINQLVFNYLDQIWFDRLVYCSRVPDERFLRICLNRITHTCMIHRWNEENKPHRNKDVVAMYCMDGEKGYR
jgi:hypothetical protein